METSTTTSESDRQYFESYEDIESHEIMLKDRPRNKAYLRALELANLEGKVVLDVGAGAAAFLSMAAARFGAKKVYAVEASRMADNAEAIVDHNGYSGVVEVIRGRIEDVVLPEKVDVIVSEWMGFYLLHESMLASVLVARDRYVCMHRSLLTRPRGHLSSSSAGGSSLMGSCSLRQLPFMLARSPWTSCTRRSLSFGRMWRGLTCLD